LVGTVQAPVPINLSSSLDKIVQAGSFSYKNKSGGPQRIGGIVITVSDPGILAALTVTLKSTGQSVTVSPVTSSNTLTFDPAISVEVGQTLNFSVTARTGETAAAIMAQGVAYAGMISGRGSTPLAGGLLLLGAMLMPMGIRQRRRAVWMALAAVMLIATMAGCSNGGTAGPSTITSQVEASGELRRQARLSMIKVKSGDSGPTTTQTLTAFVFNP
jgi:hypothetical protein